MDSALATLIFLFDLFVYGHYYVHYDLFERNNQKKFLSSQPTKSIFLIHVFSGMFELSVGYLAVLMTNSGSHSLSYVCIASALLFHIPTGLAMAPHVWGIKYLTVPGYVGVGLLRASVALRVFLQDPLVFEQSWILLHMGVLVRFVSCYVVPFTSKGGRYGDLSISPVYHTMSVAIASAVTVALVFPPWYNVLFLGAYAWFKMVYDNVPAVKKMIDSERCSAVFVWKSLFSIVSD